MGRRSGAQRPVAALGASVRREALVSQGLSHEQASLALSRRRLTAARPYRAGGMREPRVACGKAVRLAADLDNPAGCPPSHRLDDEMLTNMKVVP